MNVPGHQEPGRLPPLRFECVRKLEGLAPEILLVPLEALEKAPSHALFTPIPEAEPPPLHP